MPLSLGSGLHRLLGQPRCAALRGERLLSSQESPEEGDGERGSPLLPTDSGELNRAPDGSWRRDPGSWFPTRGDAPGPEPAEALISLMFGYP